MPSVTAIGHITLTVTDVEHSAAWYARALGLTRVRDMEGPTWRRVLMANEGVIIGLQEHDSTPSGSSFDETRIGLDHLSIACGSRAEIEEWLAHLDSEGITHSDISAPPANVATVKDPDGISIEFFAMG